MNQNNVSGRHRKTLAATAVAAAVLFSGLLTGCSSTSDTAATAPVASVASVPSTGPAPARTTAAPAEGPLIRFDTSGEEMSRLMGVWGKCLKENGVPGVTEQVLSKMPPEFLTGHADAVAACESKKPESINDRFERKHPEQAQAHLRQFIKCMQNAGQKIIFIAPDGWGVSDQQAESGFTPDEKITAKCEQKAYGG